MVFTFTLNYQLTSDESDMDALMERLAEEGCSRPITGGWLTPGLQVSRKASASIAEALKIAVKH